MDEESNNSIGSIFDAIDQSGGTVDEQFKTGESPLEENVFSQVEITVPDEDDVVVNPPLPDESKTEIPVIEDVPPVQLEQTAPPVNSVEEETKPFVPSAGNEQNLTTENADKEEVKPFDEKAAAKDIMSGAEGTSKPPVLNKSLILYIIFGVLIFVLVFALFIFPAITKKREKLKNQKPVAEEVSNKDYQSMAYTSEKYEEQAKNYNPETPKEERKLNEDGVPEIVIDDKYKYKGEEKNTSTSTSSAVMSTGSVVKERPDTSEDALQTKTINGIKGLTNTQRNYLTPDTSGYTYNTSLARTQGTSGNALDSSNPYAQYGLPADKNEYLSTLLQQYGQSGNEQSTYTQQNDQSGKMKFYENGKGQTGGQWLPLNCIWQGTIFEAVLTSNICTDLPGECTAVISKNIYSSQDGSVLLIPQNSKLLGSYNSSISYSQSRVQVGWHTLIRPDGYEISLGNMNATDTKGASGLKGLINDHPFQYLKALALMSAFNIITQEFQASKLQSDNQYVQNILANSIEVTNTLGSKLIDRAMDVQPTITIKAGTQINIVANTDLVIPALEPYEVTQPYHKTK